MRWPEAGGAPEPVPLVGRLPLAVFRWHRAPRGAGAHHPQDAGEHGPVVMARPPRRWLLGREQRRDRRHSASVNPASAAVAGGGRRERVVASPGGACVARRGSGEAQVEPYAGEQPNHDGSAAGKRLFSQRDGGHGGHAASTNALQRGRNGVTPAGRNGVRLGRSSPGERPAGEGLSGEAASVAHSRGGFSLARTPMRGAGCSSRSGLRRHPHYLRPGAGRADARRLQPFSMPQMVVDRHPSCAPLSVCCGSSARSRASRNPR